MTESINALRDRIKKFRDEREWQQFHNHKDMAISIVLEASELLEHFQWKTPEEIDRMLKVKKEEIEDEMADIFVYLLEMSENMNVDIIKASHKKLDKNDKKYPVNKSKGNALKYTEL